MLKNKDIESYEIKIEEDSYSTLIIFKDDNYIIVSESGLSLKGQLSSVPFFIPFSVLKNSIFKYVYNKKRNFFSINFKHNSVSYVFQYNLNKIDLISKITNLEFNLFLSRFDLYLRDKIEYYIQIKEKEKAFSLSHKYHIENE